MASLFLRPVFRSQFLGLGLGVSIGAFHLKHQSPIRLDTATGWAGESTQTRRTHTKSRNSTLNPAAIKQISSGSIIGLMAGWAISTFSRSLAFLIGILVVGVQWAARYGIDIVPYHTLQRYFKSIDGKSAMRENAAFKLSFGLALVMAGFLRFQ